MNPRLELLSYLAFIAIATLCYLFLDWGILQLIGVTFVVSAPFSAFEKLSTASRLLLSAILFGLLVAAHFYLDDSIFYALGLLLSAVLYLVAAICLRGIIKPQAAIGSLLTVYFLGTILLTPLATYVLYTSLHKLAWL